MKRALVLAAGGVTGALYEVGVLRAVEERLGPPQGVFDLFLGVSAGASVAAYISQGVLPSRLFEALLRDGDSLFPLRQRDVASLDLRQAARLAGTAARFLGDAAARLLRLRPGTEPEPARPALPAGLFSVEPYRRFLARALSDNGLTDDFRLLSKPLLVPATDLDSGRRVVFGEPPWDDLPISTAVAASSAIPVFFEPLPVRGRQFIDGNVGKVAHLDLLLERGATEALVVSPLVPVHNGPESCIVPLGAFVCGSLRERGLWTIFSQAMRIEHHGRLHLGIDQSPELQVHLIEPEPSDATLFLANPMSLTARREILEGAYLRTGEALERRADEFGHLRR